jgi:uncharacterized protein (UPF0332 family)
MRHDDVLLLVRYRLEQANEALADAEFLFAGQRGPRSIVNRAYYAMFYAVLALFKASARSRQGTPARLAYSTGNSC